jgi:phytoene dehydrogenase-like protein
MSARVVVVGGGVNELVAAQLLARSGRSVILISESTTEHEEEGWITPDIMRELALERHGLKAQLPDPWAVAPLPDGGRLELWRDVGRSAESIRRVSPRDAAKWPEFCGRMARLARFLEKLYAEPPPDPLSLRFALRARRLGAGGLVDLLRLMPMSAAELLDDWFEADALKGVLGAAGVRHLQQGPRSGGTVFRLLHHHVGNPPGVFLPPRSNVVEVLRKLPGVETRSERIHTITVREGRAGAVVTENGEEIPADLIVSGIGPRRTLLELVDPGWLDPELVRALRHLRSRGVLARLSLELERPAGFSTLVVAPSLDYLERAYDDAKYGRTSTEPWLETRCEGTSAEVDVQYVPYGAQVEPGLESKIVRMLSAHVGIAQCTVHPPRDLEALYGWPQGQAHHAELALDQALWMRPLPELAQYRTPIEGLWLCGPAMHPGGSVAGAAGANAARAILRAA